MTRQVHFDPFGMRLAGYQAGINDEVQLQDTTRRARQADYQYKTTQPLELQGLQRNERLAANDEPYAYRRQYFGDQAADRGNQLGAATLPYAIKGLDYTDQASRGTLYSAEVPRLVEYGQRTGDWGRLGALDDSRYAPTSVQPAQTHAVDSPANKAFDDWSALMEQEGLAVDDPIAQQYQQQLEQIYGLQPGSLMQPGTQMGPQQYQTTPGMRTYRNPVTGEVTQYPGFNPQSYEQYGFYDKSLQLQQQQNAIGNLQVQQEWQRQKAQQAGGEGGEAAGPLGYYSGN